MPRVRNTHHHWHIPDGASICRGGKLPTLLVLSPPTRIPTIRKEQTAKRPNAESPRLTASIRATASRTVRERSAIAASDTLSPHSAIRITAS